MDKQIEERTIRLIELDLEGYEFAKERYSTDTFKLEIERIKARIDFARQLGFITILEQNACLMRIGCGVVCSY